jgi:hypothetical protein
MIARDDISSGTRPIILTTEQLRALPQFHRAVAEVCIERGSGEVILIGDRRVLR